VTFSIGQSAAHSDQPQAIIPAARNKTGFRSDHANRAARAIRSEADRAVANKRLIASIEKNWVFT